MGSSSDNLLQLENNSALPKLTLNNVVEDSSHISGLISLAPVAIKTDKDHYFRNENLNPIDISLVILSQFSNTINGDTSSHCPSTPLNLTSMDVV